MFKDVDFHICINPEHTWKNMHQPAPVIAAEKGVGKTERGVFIFEKNKSGSRRIRAQGM